MKIICLTECKYFFITLLITSTIIATENNKSKDLDQVITKNVKNKINFDKNNSNSILNKKQVDFIDFNTNFSLQISSKELNKKKLNEIFQFKKEPKENNNKIRNATLTRNFYEKKENEKNNKIIEKKNSQKILNKKEIIDKDKIFTRAENISCDLTICPSPNSCNTEKNTCICDPGYAEFTNSKSQEINPNLLTYTNFKKIDLEGFSSKITNTASKKKQNNIIHCGYKRKSKLIYLLLEVFLNLGIGHIYMGKFELGKIKFIIITFPWALFFILILNRKILLDDNKLKINELPVILYLIWIVWWLYDFMYIYKGKFDDENGIPLI